MSVGRFGRYRFRPISADPRKRRSLPAVEAAAVHVTSFCRSSGGPQRFSFAGDARARGHGRRAGLNRLAWCFISLRLALFAATCVLFQRFGLSIVVVQHSGARNGAEHVRSGLALSLRVAWTTGEWIVAETLLIALLLLSLTYHAAPAQYAAVAQEASQRRVAGAADRVLGVHVPALAAWTREHFR